MTSKIYMLLSEPEKDPFLFEEFYEKLVEHSNYVRRNESQHTGVPIVAHSAN